MREHRIEEQNAVYCNPKEKKRSDMDIGKVSELKEFIESCKSNPSLLHTPSLQFFKSYLLRYSYLLFFNSIQFNSVIPISISCSFVYSLGARIPPQPKMEPVVDDNDDDIIESDIELDNTDDVVQPDNDPPQKMGDPSAQVTEDQRDAAQLSKSKALDAISQGHFDQALDLLTQAILLNPHSSILYATRASVFIKLKKPNAAICDADTALKINPDSAKGYKIRGLSRAMLGLWTEALTDLHVASKIDYDEEIAMALKKVTCLLSSVEIKLILLVAFFLYFLLHRLSQMLIKSRSIGKNMNAYECKRSRKELNRRSNHKIKLK